MRIIPAYTQTMARYRLRTELRGILPHALARLVPKGRRDCGAHEYYRADEQTDRCYHCEVGVRADPAVALSGKGSPQRAEIPHVRRA